MRIAALLLALVAVARADDDYCEIYDEAMTCSNESASTASWCEYQNPLLVPSPLTELTTADNIAYADYEPQYKCDGDDWDANCELVTTFFPAQVSNNASAIYDRMIVVGQWAANAAQPWQVAAFKVYTPYLDAVIQVQLDASVELVYTFNFEDPKDPDAPEVSMILYGGNRADGLADIQFQWCYSVGNWSQSNTLVYDVYKFVGTFLGGVDLAHAVYTLPDEISVSSLFYNDTETIPGQWELLNCVATMTHDINSTLDYQVWFLCVNSSKLLDYPRSRVWQVSLPDESYGELTMDIEYHHVCDDDSGTFVNDELCSSRPLVVLTDAKTVSIFEYTMSGTVGGLTIASAMQYGEVSTVPTLLLPYGVDEAPETVFYEAPADVTVAGADVFGYQLQFTNATTLENEYAALNTSDIDGNFSVVVGEVRQPLAVAVLTEGSNTGLGSSEYQLNVLALTEFGNAISTDSSMTDPAGIGNGNACADTLDYFDGVDCVAREAHLVIGSDDERLTGVTQRWRGVPTSAVDNCTSSESSVSVQECIEAIVESAASDDVTAAYGARHVLFVSTDVRTVQLAYVTEYPASCSPDATLHVQAVNELSMMGNVQLMNPTDNAQFLFTAIARQRWELESMERLYEICELLANDSTNAFLSSWQDACDGGDVRLPQVTDFMQVASACPTGTYCGTFNEEEIEVLGDGEFSYFEFDRQTCPKGSYCISGVKFSCPIGFVCPETGLSLPVRCEFDLTRSTTCGVEGLVEAAPVSDGTMSVAPYMPALPASPGYAVSVDSDGVTLELEACSNGEWCSLGLAEDMGLTVLNCTAAFYCEEPDVVEPELCDWDGTCSADSCPVMPWCPAGTADQDPCPAGYYCSDTSTEISSCGVGAYCPAGTSLWAACPEKYYCPDPTEAIICPSGHYCPLASVSPIACGPLDVCDTGSASQSSYLPVLVLTLGPGAFYVAYLVYEHYKLKFRVEREEARAKARESELPAMGASADAEDLARGLLDGERSLMTKDFTIDFDFEDLGLKLKGSGQSILAGVTGSIRHGRVTAVMGPSGAGKSTFVTTLAGKAYYGDMVGTVKINGVEQSLKRYKKLVGFVPQEDIMLRELTVKENIVSSARLRLPMDWSATQRARFVDLTLDMLGLREIRHSRIGDESKRGISGGQRKRVNIGMELVADPTVIFLDEPTSGLDSTSSMEVCTALRKIAEAGVNLVTVIHQPRYEIFVAFHDVLLLGKGGRTVYLGPSGEALGYFENFGLACPPRVNPPDFMMDVIAGDVGAEFARAHPDWHPNDLFTWWEESLVTRKAQALEADAANDRGFPSRAAEAEALDRKQAPFFFMLGHFFTRACHQLARAKRNLVLDVALVFVAAVFLGAVYYNEPWYQAPLPIQAFNGCPSAIADQAQTCFVATGDAILNRGSMTAIGIGLTATASMIRVFGSEKIVYWRESAALQQPYATVAYFLGKDLAHVPLALVAPFVYDLVFHAMTTPRASFGTFYVTLLGLYWTSMGFSYLVSVVAPPALAQLCGVVSVFGNAMFAGGSPTYKQMLGKFVPLRYFPHFSYIRYGLEAFYVGEAAEWKDLDELMGMDLEEFVQDTYGYSLDAWGYCIAMLFLFGVVARVLAVLAMLYKDRDKKL